jgi:purine-cytosine permease-like protein
MRILNILSGLAVLFTTLAFGHLLHHYFLTAGEALHSPLFLAGMIICVVVGIFSFIGGCLLLRRGR